MYLTATNNTNSSSKTKKEPKRRSNEFKVVDSFTHLAIDSFFVLSLGFQSIHPSIHASTNAQHFIAAHLWFGERANAYFAIHK
jgi:hypothetical protein